MSKILRCDVEETSYHPKVLRAWLTANLIGTGDVNANKLQHAVDLYVDDSTI